MTMRKKIPSIASTMSPFPYAIDSDSSLDAAKTMMQEHSVHHLPVTENDILVGMITHHDVKVTDYPFSYKENSETLLVRDVCSQRCHQVDIHGSIQTVLSLLLQDDSGAVTVTKGDRIVGIVTYADVCQKCLDILHDIEPSDEGGDAA